MWDMKSNKEVNSFKGHTGSVTSADFSPDGNWVVSSGNDGKINIWDINANKILHTFENQEKNVTCVRFNP